MILTALTGQAPPPARPRHADVPPTLAGRRYLGWIKTGAEPWRVACGADDYDGCWALLLDVPGGRSNKRMVLRKEWRP